MHSTSTELQELFSKHKKVVLSFSGGKDSAALLWLCQPWWEQCLVVWCRAGSQVCLVEEYVGQVEKLVPHFARVEGDSDAWRGKFGAAVDWQPVSNALAPSWQCCMSNLWVPLAKFIAGCGATAVLRGQKNSDIPRNKELQHGATVDGLQYYYPLRDWLDEDVFVYLGDQVPPVYAAGGGGFDCATCTAYTMHSKNRLQFLADNEPEHFAQVSAMLPVILDDYRQFCESVKETFHG